MKKLIVKLKSNELQAVLPDKQDEFTIKKLVDDLRREAIRYGVQYELDFYIKEEKENGK